MAFMLQYNEMISPHEQEQAKFRLCRPRINASVRQPVGFERTALNYEL